MIEYIDSYLFGEVSSIPYVTLRVMFGVLIIVTFFEFLVSYELMAPVSEGGFLHKKQSSMWQVPTIFKIFNCPYYVFMGLYLVCGICITIGFFSIVFLIILFYLIISIRSFALTVIGGGDTIMQIVCFWLIFSNPDQCFSITSLIIPEDYLFTTVPWPGRAMIAEISLFYCLSVFAKLKGPTWRKGVAVWNVMNFPDRHKWKWPVKFLENKIFLIKVCTYYVMVVELLAPIGFFVKPLIPIWVFLLFCMHLGIELTMFVGLFGYWMLAFLIFLFLTYLYW